MGDSRDTWSEGGTPPVPAPQVLGGRWRLGPELGRGGFGRVYVADDLQGGPQAAVKVLPYVGTAQRRRLQRELAALRHLTAPGVVHLLDDGPAGPGHFIAMERLPGVSFPGVGSWTWSRLRPIAVRLLEAVRDVHDAGVIHRDLKPGNVLMRGGQPVILDFGLARGDGLGSTITRSGTPMGTVRYVSPEQGMGGRVSARTDLYSVGVMLYEALSGTIPHDAGDAAELLRVKVTRPPRSLGEVCPGAPVEAVSVIDAMLAMAPEDRPGSAQAVLTQLAAGAGSRSPWIGPQSWLDDLVERVRRGAHVRLGGAAGSGRTRTLQEVAGRLPHLWLRPGRSPYSSLTDALDGLELHSAGSADEARARVGRRLRDRFGMGSVVLLDSGGIDWSSRRAIDGHPGGVLEVVDGPGDLQPPTPDEHSLRGWFHGPERVLHLPSDGARELLRRAGPGPASLLHELRAWERAGLCTRPAGGVELRRGSLDRLRAEDPPRPRGRPLDAPTLAALPPELEAVLELVDHTAPCATVSVLHGALGREAWLLDAQVEELEGRGYLRVAEGRFWPVGPRRRGGALSVDQRTAASEHVAARLAPGAPGRLRHLLDAAAPAPVVLDEAVRTARRFDAQGRFSRARAMLADTIAGVAPDAAGQDDALALWVRLALESGEGLAIAPCLEQVRRRSAPGGPLVRLLEARDRVRAGDGAGALRLLDGLPAFGDPELEALRLREVQLTATRLVHGGDGEALRAVLDEREADPQAITWRAMLAYREGRMREAAQEHERAAARWAADGPRLRSLLSAATCWSWGGAAPQARQLALQGRREAAERRLPSLELRAEWVLRNIAQKSGETLVDEELVQIASSMSPDMPEASFVLLTEAYIAWAGEDRPRAARLADAVRERFDARGIGGGVQIAGALVAASEGDAATLSELIDPRHPVAALDAVALLRGVSGDASAAHEVRRAVTAEWPWLVGSHIGMFRVEPD